MNFKAIIVDTFPEIPEDAELASFSSFEEAKTFIIAYARVFIARQEESDLLTPVDRDPLKPIAAHWESFMTDFRVEGGPARWSISQEPGSFSYPVPEDFELLRRHPSSHLEKLDRLEKLLTSRWRQAGLI